MGIWGLSPVEPGLKPVKNAKRNNDDAGGIYPHNMWGWFGYFTICRGCWRGRTAACCMYVFRVRASNFTEFSPRKPIYLNYPRCHPRGRSDAQGPIHHSPRLAPANGKIFKLTPHILEINSTPYGDYPRAPGETVKKCTILEISTALHGDHPRAPGETA